MRFIRALRLAFATAAAVATVHVCERASAQTYPTKPITLVVPLAAGTGMDTIARLYADQLAHSLGKPVVVDNRPGASMMLATAAVAAAPADGYTLLIATSGTFAINPVLYKRINYDPDKDFMPITLLCEIAVRADRQSGTADPFGAGLYQARQRERDAA